MTTPNPRLTPQPALDDVSRRSFGELMSEVSQDLSTLIRQELELARAELSQEAVKLGKASGLLASSGMAAHMVLVFASIALWWGLSNVMDGGWAALIVAAVWAVAAAVLYASGRSQLREVRGLRRTAETVKQIPAAMRPEGGSPR